MKLTRRSDLASFSKVTTRERFDWITPVCAAGLAMFGVVLEGPMGAIAFWILLGLAHYPAPETEP